jgi:hypothetical protein
MIDGLSALFIRDQPSPLFYLRSSAANNSQREMRASKSVEM